MKTTVNQNEVYIVTCQILEATAAALDQMNPLFLLTERDLQLLADMQECAEDADINSEYYREIAEERMIDRFETLKGYDI